MDFLKKNLYWSIIDNNVMLVSSVQQRDSPIQKKCAKVSNYKKKNKTKQQRSIIKVSFSKDVSDTGLNFRRKECRFLVCLHRTNLEL